MNIIDIVFESQSFFNHLDFIEERLNHETFMFKLQFCLFVCFVLLGFCGVVV